MQTILCTPRYEDLDARKGKHDPTRQIQSDHVPLGT